MVEATFEFVLSFVNEDGEDLSILADGMDLELFSRIFKRLVRKLISKNSVNQKKDQTDSLTKENLHDTDKLYPVSGHDRLNYLRLLDVSNRSSEPPLLSMKECM